MQLFRLLHCSSGAIDLSRLPVEPCEFVMHGAVLIARGGDFHFANRARGIISCFKTLAKEYVDPRKQFRFAMEAQSQVRLRLCKSLAGDQDLCCEQGGLRSIGSALQSKGIC